MLHLLHAYLTDDCTLLGQEKTADKSNEITAIPILLETLDLKNALVSIDAMGCQIHGFLIKKDRYPKNRIFGLKIS